MNGQNERRGWRHAIASTKTLAWLAILGLAACDGVEPHGDGGILDGATADGAATIVDGGAPSDARASIDAPVAPDAGPCGGACTGATPVCDPASGTCVMCVADADCADPTPACDSASNTCVGCLDDGHCGTAMPVCDVAVAECVECISAADCDDGDHCTVDACEADRTCTHSVQDACVAALEPGAAHTCLLRAGGLVQCWGANDGGQLGDGTTVDRWVPVAVPGVADAVDVGAGSFHTCVARASGDVVCFGRSSNNRLGIPSPAMPLYTSPQPVGLSGVVQVEADRDHTCALHAGGSVSCWGLNDSGRLGDGTTTARETPVTVTGVSDAVAIALGSGHTCALRADGTVACWGRNNRGQLGDGTTSDRPSPVAVTGLTDAVGLSADGSLTCARRAAGEVVCWGYNGYGQLGDGTTDDRSAPVAVTTLVASDVGVGHEHTCARRTDGRVSCWGRDIAGQLGDGEPRVSSTTPVDVVGLTDAIVLGVSASHACALRASGEVVCWGGNASGQLGNGTTENRSAPSVVTGL